LAQGCKHISGAMGLSSSPNPTLQGDSATRGTVRGLPAKRPLLEAIIAMKRQRKGEDVDWLQRTSAEFLLSPITSPTSEPEPSFAVPARATPAPPGVAESPPPPPSRPACAEVPAVSGSAAGPLNLFGRVRRGARKVRVEEVRAGEVASSVNFGYLPSSAQKVSCVNL